MNLNSVKGNLFLEIFEWWDKHSVAFDWILPDYDLNSEISLKYWYFPS